MRMSQFLTDSHVAFETLTHPPAFTPQRRARFLEIPGRTVANCALLRGPAGCVVAILPSTCQIDTEALEARLGGPVRPATQDEIADTFRDCEWGIVPPFGSLYGVSTALDESFAPDTLIVFEGHSHAQAIRLRCRDFEALEQPERFRFARPRR